MTDHERATPLYWPPIPTPPDDAEWAVVNGQRVLTWIERETRHWQAPDGSSGGTGPSDEPPGLPSDGWPYLRVSSEPSS